MNVSQYVRKIKQKVFLLLKGERVVLNFISVFLVMFVSNCDKIDTTNPPTDTTNPITFQVTFDRGGSDKGNSVQQTTDGGYVIAGGTGMDIWLIRTDENGLKLWDKTFGSSGVDHGNSVQQTTDGGFIIAGTKDYAQPYYLGFPEKVIIKHQLP